MTGNSRVKVVGYAQRVFYNDNIEYRNFTPDLAGAPLVSTGGTALFTMGNFSVTTNFEPKVNKTFITNNFSNFVSLTDLNTTLETSLQLLLDNATVYLNLDKTDLTNYALFGSLNEYVRVSLEDIILNFPAALYVNPTYAIAPSYITSSGYTVEDYQYDSITNKSRFKVNVNTITNKFQINYLTNGNLAGTFNANNLLRDLKLNYLSYSILNNGAEFDIIEFTGSTSTTNDYLYFVVSGNSFSSVTTNGYVTYYVKPNAIQENLFYNRLPAFESYLLNRFSEPKFTSSFRYSVKADTGNVLYITEKVTWPTTDGYNIDFDTESYINFATTLSGISTNYDLTTSGLMARFLVSDSITDFDTTQTHLDPLDQDTSDQKMLKTLNIYGREYDELNNYIKGVSFAHNVTYDKNNNTPDTYLKDLARNMGWDLISSVLEMDLLKNYILPNQSSYSGYSVGLTAQEADHELWRRLILNTPWLWKSKGTRKSVEFLFKFIGTPLGLISFNEHVYVAQNKIDMDVFQQVLALNNVSTDLSLYPVSLSGYPSTLPNTPDLYYQSNGLWYRETGGSNSSVDITNGNNPHVGPYDGGYKYINQFRELIPNFSAVTISSETITTNSVNLFNNYNGGTMTGYIGNTYVDITNDEGVDFTNCVVVTSSIIEDPKHRQDQTDCGCVIEGELKSLSVCINENFPLTTCQDTIANVTLTPTYGYYLFDYKQYNIDNTPYIINGSPVYYTTPFVDKACCNFNGSQPYFYNEIDNSGSLVNSGYICCQSTNTCGCYTTCKWTLNTAKFITNTQDSKNYLLFNNETGGTTTVSVDGCNCPSILTTKTQITDPVTGKIGIGCQLTQAGMTDLTSTNSVLVKTFQQRANGTIGCSAKACNLSFTTSSVGSNNGAANGSISITPSGGIAPYTYTWTKGGTPTNITNITTSPYVISNLVNGSYTISVSDSTTCSATTSVVVDLTPCTLNVVSTIQGQSNGANNGSISIVVTGAINGYTVKWYSVGVNNILTLIGTNVNMVSGLVAGNYSVTVTDSLNCVKTLLITVPTVDCSYLTLKISRNGSTLSSIVTGSQNVTYQWYLDNNPIVSGTHPTQAVVGAGKYTLMVTDTNTGCLTKDGPIIIELVGTSFLIAYGTCNNSTTLSNSACHNGQAPFQRVYSSVNDNDYAFFPNHYVYNADGTPFDGSGQPCWSDGNIYGKISALGLFTQVGTCV